jgi:hypothetical protein
MVGSVDSPPGIREAHDTSNQIVPLHNILRGSLSHLFRKIVASKDVIVKGHRLTTAAIRDLNL